MICKERAVQFWVKLLKNQESLTFKVYKSEVDAIGSNSINNQVIKKRNWATNIKKTNRNAWFC